MGCLLRTKEIRERVVIVRFGDLGVMLNSEGCGHAGRHSRKSGPSVDGKDGVFVAEGTASSVSRLMGLTW